MALDKEKLKNDIIAIQTQMITKESADIEEFAHLLATAIDKFVKSGQVEIPAGISVQTQGSATAQIGQTTQKAFGKIK